jgi:hypothetical protein
MLWSVVECVGWARADAGLFARLVDADPPSAFLVVSCGRFGFGALGELPPCFSHLEKQGLVAIVCG